MPGDCFAARFSEHRMTLKSRVPVYAAGDRLAAFDVRRKFEARRPQCAVQRSIASVRWAVLDGHEPTLMNGWFKATRIGRLRRALVHQHHSPVLNLYRRSGNQVQPSAWQVWYPPPRRRRLSDSSPSREAFSQRCRIDPAGRRLRPPAKM
jgi:hypothetical protein